MIALVGVSAVALALLDSSITGPTTTFRGCLHEAASKASGEKVGGDKIEGYLKATCSVQMNALTSAIIAFNMKSRGMSKKAAADDAAMTVDDYVATPADNYKFLVGQNASQPAAVSTQPPKP